VNHDLPCLHHELIGPAALSQVAAVIRPRLAARAEG
jgi:hypothetical protein